MTSKYITMEDANGHVSTFTRDSLAQQIDQSDLLVLPLGLMVAVCNEMSKNGFEFKPDTTMEQISGFFTKKEGAEAPPKSPTN